VAELRERFGTSVVIDLVRGGRGIFEVEVDGTRVFSKHQLGRFPDAGELADLVAAR
jgi:selT/selW/selH-like putative selenoprotein